MLTIYDTEAGTRVARVEMEPPTVRKVSTTPAARAFLSTGRVTLLAGSQPGAETALTNEAREVPGRELLREELQARYGATPLLVREPEGSDATLAEDAERGGTGDAGPRSGGGTGPFAAIPVLPDDLDTLTRGWLIRWAEWVAADRPEIDEADRLSATPRHASLDFNPALHPRDPETGQFVERPFNLPDGAPDFGDRSVKETVQFLDENGADVAAVLDPDTSVTIDGVPNDARSIDDIPEGDGEEADADGPDAPDDGPDAPDDGPDAPDDGPDAPDDGPDAGDDGPDAGDGGEGRAVSKSEIDSFQEDLEAGDRIEFDDGSETPPIEEVVEDDGTVAAIHEDGFLTEDVFLEDPDTGRDLTPEGEAIQEELGVDTVDLSGLEEGARQDLVSTLREEWDDELRGYFGALGSVQTSPPSDLQDEDGGDAAAAFQGSTRTLYINPDTYNETPADAEIRPGGIGIGPTDRQTTVQHELGHARHFFKDARAYGELRGEQHSERAAELAREEVSSYAAYNPHEYVAEVYAGLQNGVEFDEGVLELYESYSGPDVDPPDAGGGDGAAGDALDTREGAFGEVAELASGPGEERVEEWTERFDTKRELMGILDERDMTPEEYREEIDEQLRDQLEGASVRMALGTDTLRTIIDEDGRFKNQHEVGASRGTYDPDMRAELEEAKFGSDTDAVRDLPKYGYVRGADDEGPGEAGMDFYGGARVVFSDDVKKQTTVTSGDSLEHSTDELQNLGTPLNDPSYQMLSPIGRGSDPLEDLEEEHITERGRYLEAQMHGELSLEDVEKVEIPRSDALTDEQRQQLSDAGVTIESRIQKG